MDVQNSPVGIHRTKEGLQFSGCEIFNYPIEVRITETAIKAFSQAYSQEGLISQINIYLQKRQGEKKALCSINSNFFGFMTEFKDVFAAGHDLQIKRAIYEVHSSYMDSIKQFSKYYVM